MPNIRPFLSISVQGYVIPPYSSVILRPCKKAKSIRGGLLRAHNNTGLPQTLMPSQKAQKQYPDFSPTITGDTIGFASRPMAWTNPNILFEILSLPHSLLPGQDRELPEDMSREITARGSRWPMVHLVSCVPIPIGSTTPPGPDNPKNYMGYDRTNWEVFQVEIQEGILQNVDLIIGRCQHAAGGRCGGNEFAYVLPLFGKRLAFVVEKPDGGSYSHQTDNLGLFLNSIGTSGCISLLQKAIRRRPATMRHPETGEHFDTVDIVRRISLRMCCGNQTGFFLPRVGKFVTSLQHFLKRLFIIAAEDSIYDKEDMFFISTSALLASEIGFWKPSKGTVDRFVDISVKLLMSSVTSRYNTTSKLSAVDHYDFVRGAPSMIQKAMGGMEGDQQMLRWLAMHPSDQNCIGNSQVPLQGVDPLDIYCDQHQDGRMVCFLQQSSVGFAEQLSEAFRAVSGHNTRRRPRSEQWTPYEKMVLDAFRNSSAILRKKVVAFPHDAPSGPNITYEIPRGAIAGMVGTIEMTYKRSKYYVTVSSRDINNFVVIPKPSRDNKEGMESITPEVRDIIVAETRQMLYRPKRKIRLPVEDIFAGLTVHLVGSTWYVGQEQWEIVRHRTVQLQKPLDWSALNAAVEVDWTDTFTGTPVSSSVKQFTLGRMAGYERLITIPKINRVGEGTDEALTGFEASAWQYLKHLSRYFPDAIWPSNKKPYAFETRSVELRRLISQRMKDTLVPECVYPTFQYIHDLRPNQQLALEEMLDADARGYANFLWMLVGQGKTLTVLRFLEQTRKCRYIVWSVPKSGIASIARQIKEVGWKPLMLYPSPGLLNKSRVFNESNGFEATLSTMLRPDCVTLIEHDHLYKMVDSLAKRMCDTAFVFDEVHKAMQSQTKRTASSLRLARISKQLIALTGTPIVDRSGYGLMEWLRLCVPFPVATSNFWVAANSMVSKLNTGNVFVEEREEQAPEDSMVTFSRVNPGSGSVEQVTTTEPEYFKTHFPTRTPWNGETPAPTRLQWIQMRDVSRNIVDRRIVAIARELYLRHPQKWKEEHVVAVELKEQALFENTSQRPLIVTDSSGHTCKLARDLLDAGIAAQDILVVGGGRPLELPLQIKHEKKADLTERSVLEEKHPPYKMVIASKTHCEGYSLTWLTCMLTGLYPSNTAARTQMRGRINRLDAQRLRKTYITVLAGVTTITFRYQDAARLMEKALQGGAARQQKRQKKY
jgi:hypothetical protein